MDGPDLSEGELFEDLPCGVVVTDAKGAIVRVNRTFCTWVACESAAIVGRRKLQDFFPMGGRIFHQTHWLPALQMQGSLAEVKFDILRTDGRLLPMMLNAVRHVRGDGYVDVVTLTLAEERNKYERELLAARRRADELLEKERATQLVLEDRALFAEQMIGIVSHDLRNPLSAILAGAGMLDRDPELLQNRRERLVRAILSSARSAQELIENLLDFTLARIGRGLTVDREAVDLHALVARCVDNLALAFPGRALQHATLGAGPSRVDGGRIAQLLGNLVGNAMAYGDPGEPVRVTSEITEGMVRISVHNVGAPIPSEMLASMFEPMVRGDAVDASTRSVGLGLFIVRAIATAHGGAVAVRSTAAEGTTFTFSCASA